MSNYWERRQAQMMYEYMESAEKKADEIAKLYQKASWYLSAQADAVFDKYMDKHGLSENEARRLLNQVYDKTSLDEMLAKLDNGDKDESRKELKKKLEAPAYQARLDRFRKLQDQLDMVMMQIYKQEKQMSTDFYTELASESYYKSMYTLQQQADAAFSFSYVDAKTIDQVINSRWSGENYSSRIWKNTKGLAEDLKEQLLLGLVTGKTHREMAREIQLKYAAGASQARRLVRTESNFVTTELNFKAYEEAGIKKYRYLATLDLKTSKICRELDGKIFPVEERKSGENCPPMHPWCRSTTIAYISADVMADMKRRARDPVTGKLYEVPGDMNYQEWYAKYVEGNTEAEAREKASKNTSSDQKQFEQYREVLGDDMPKSFAEFQKMKYNESEKWKFMKLDYQRQHELLEHPELKLPNAENAILPEPKFTKYLFDENSEKGYPKGRAFTDRLGYGMENWQKLQKALKQGAMKYPALYVDNNGYGDRYVQKMILYGEKGTPANVIVAWLKNTDGTTKLTSAYIKEMK